MSTVLLPLISELHQTLLCLQIAVTDGVFRSHLPYFEEAKHDDGVCLIVIITNVALPHNQLSVSHRPHNHSQAYFGDFEWSPEKRYSVSEKRYYVISAGF